MHMVGLMTRLRLISLDDTVVFPGMPVFYQAFAEMTDVPPLKNLRLCVSAGAPLSANVAKQFRQKFKLPIHSFYGSSECGGICYDQAAENSEEGFVGEPMSGVGIELIDPNSPPTQIRVKSAAVGDGYFPNPDEDKLGNGVFTPDDLLARSAVQEDRVQQPALKRPVPASSVSRSRRHR